MKLKHWIVPVIVATSVLIAGGSVFAATATHHGQYATKWSTVTGHATSNVGSTDSTVNGGGGYGVMGGYGSGANGGGGYGMMGSAGSGVMGGGAQGVNGANGMTGAFGGTVGSGGMMGGASLGGVGMSG